MRNQRFVRRRQLVKGAGIIDSVYGYGRDGVNKLKKGVISGVKHYIKAGSRYGLNQLAKQGHRAVDYLESTANNKIGNLVGSGLPASARNRLDTNGVDPYLVKQMPARINRNLILREIQQSLGGMQISSDRRSNGNSLLLQGNKKGRKLKIVQKEK